MRIYIVDGDKMNADQTYELLITSGCNVNPSIESLEGEYVCPYGDTVSVVFWDEE